MAYDDYIECYVDACIGEQRCILRKQYARAHVWQRVQRIYLRLMRGCVR